MRNLFIDTCSSKRICAYLEDDNLKEIIVENNGVDLSERMLPMIKEVLDKSRVLPMEIDNIFVVAGPGSFTGIRIGVTIAKTFAWALKKKIIPLSELEVYSSGKYDISSKKDTLIIPYINARRDYVYSGIYRSDMSNFMQDTHISVEELFNRIPDNSDVIFTSYDNEPITLERVQKIGRGINARVVECSFAVEKVVNKHLNDNGVNPHECNPIYLKKTEAEEKLEND